MHHFEVALSYAGEQRPLVEAIAERLAATLGRDHVFYDRYHEAELPYVDFDLHLQALYHDRARLVVVFLGKDYLRKDWPGSEWRAVRDLILQGASERIVLVRVDDTPAPGVFALDRYLDAQRLSPELIADRILERLRHLDAPQAAGRLPSKPSAASGVTAVPRLPPHFLPRPDDLIAIKHNLLDSDAARLGITSVRLSLGVQGMGGIGKSVLAAALAQDEEVSAAFPHGIFWVAVGQQPDLVRLQIDLAVAAGAPRPVIDSPSQGKLLLSRAFAGKSVLLVLDDIWKADHVTALDVLGRGSCLLITTRDAELLVNLEAREHRIEVLSPDQALLLLADWVGQPLEDLPAVARQVARECGYLPLALAMIGAMVRLRPTRPTGPTGWDDALERLEGADLDKIRRDYPDYPYPDLLRAIEVSVAALASQERQRYLELAVFPEDAAVPGSVLETLWAAAGLSAADARDLAAKLVARSLGQWDAAARLRLHDLQADYLRHEAGDPQLLHARLVDAYAARCPQGFAGGPPDGYFFAHLTSHLRAAGRVGELRALLLGYPWFEAKLAATDINALLSDYDAFRDDIELRLVEDALRLAAHVLIDRPEELPGQLLGRLLGRTEPGILALLERAHPVRPRSWIRPLAASLTPPGGSLVRILTGHADRVSAVAVLPDGRVVSGSRDGSLRVWDVVSGQILRTFERYWLSVKAVAALSDSRVVSGSEDHTLRIWDVASGQPLRTLKGHSGSVGAVAVLPGGRIASGSTDRTLRVWDVASGQTLQTLEGHSRSVEAVAVLPDGRVVSGSRDHTLRVWDVASRQTLRTLEGHSDPVAAVAVLADARVVSGSDDHSLRVWDVASAQTLRTLIGHSAPVKAVAVLSDGRVVSGSEDHTLRVWDVASGRTLRALEGHSDVVVAVAVMPDGRVVSASHDNTLRVWDVASGQTLRTVEGQSPRVFAVAVLPDGRVVSSSRDGTLRVWDVASGQTPRTVEVPSGLGLAVLAALPDGRVVSTSWGGTLEVRDMASGQTLRTLEGHSKSVRAVAVLPNGRVVSASDDHTLRVWDVASGKTLQILRDSEKVRAVAVLPDGRVVSGSDRTILRVWDAVSGQTLQTLEGHRDLVLAVAVLPDGRVISASDDRTLRVWDPASGQTFASLTLDAPATALAVFATRNFVAADRSGRLHFLSVDDPS